MNKVLFVGRFQPFHKGHLHAIKKLLERFDEVVVVIGSAEKSNTRENPFSFEERKRMIQNELGERCRIIGVPDVENDEEWVGLIRKKVEFDAVVSGNAWTRSCFTRAGYRVIEPDYLDPKKYDGSLIREKIFKNDDEWKELVPKGTLKVLETINVKKRLKE